MRKFSHLKKRGARNAVVKGVRAGADPQVKEARRNAPRETGLLRRRTTKKIKRYGQGKRVLAVIGAKSGKDPATGRNPAWYAHLIEGGVQPHTIHPKKAKRLRFAGHEGGVGRDRATGRYKKTQVTVYRRKVLHPGLRGTRFMERAYRAKKLESIARFRSKFTSEVMIEARKQG